MKVLKQHAQKHADEFLRQTRPDILNEVLQFIESINAVDVLTKISKETSKINKWGGLLFSPPALNAIFRSKLLEPGGWLKWNDRTGNYSEHGLYFPDASTVRGADRYRKIDGIKEGVGLEVQMGKYAFMGYDIFSKMVIFYKQQLIDSGIEIVPVQDMVNCMSTGVSAFEAIMIDFQNRGEADIDIPVLVLGIGPSEEEWRQVHEVQELFRLFPQKALEIYPAIGRQDRKGTKPGPK